MEEMLFVCCVIFALGVGARIGQREAKRPWLLTVVSVLLAVLFWVYAFYVPSHGSEGPGILATMVSAFAAGTVVTEIVFAIRRRFP